MRLDKGQCISVRFDDELAGLVERTPNCEFAKTKDIKLAIKTSRPDDRRA